MKLDYDPLESGENMRKFLGDLLTWILDGRIWHRQAAACRGIIETALTVAGYAEVRGKIDEIQRELADARSLHEQMAKGPQEIIMGFVKSLPSALQSQVTEYMKEQAKLEEVKAPL